MIPHDYHIHTNFSCDCNFTMMEMCRAALARDIPEVGFCDHYDLLPEAPCHDFFRADDWWEEIDACRQAFQGSLVIRAGVELGEPHLFPAETRKLLQAYPWDFSLGSLHWVGLKHIFDPGYFDRPAEEAYREYFLALTEMVAQGAFDILAHLDALKRRGFDVYGGYNEGEHEDRIRAVLRMCAREGIAVEVNSAPLRRSVGETAPGPSVVKWFLEEGVRLVTLGSDAHKPEHVGHGLQEAVKQLRRAGFDHLARYEGRRATLLPLPQPG